MLVKNAVTAVNHANLTGNYTVLRDLGALAFRQRNSAAKLAAIVQRFRDQKTDLSPTLLLDPQFTQPPAMNEHGQLVMVGYFPTQPLQVHFRLAFQRVQGGWVIDTISVGTSQAQAPPARSTDAAAFPRGNPPVAPGTNPREAARFRPGNPALR